MKKAKNPAGRRLLEVAARIAERREVDWDRALEESTDQEPTLRGLRRLASIQAAFSQVLASAQLTEAKHGQSADESLPFQWGHLEVRERLGAGSYAEVYRAYDPLLDREVALKLLRPGTAASSGWLQEARRLARVRHPNVLVIHGVDTHDDRPGFWTDLVRGSTLDERLAETGPAGVREVCYIGIELCRALSAVHAAGIVHGDVKAANVLREKGGRLVLTDFGAASEPRDETDPAVAGTPLTMAPELFAGMAPSPASDVYALGVLLFRCVTGRYPVEADSAQELRDRQARAQETGDLRIPVALPTDFRVVLERALAPNVEARFDTARSLERQLIATLSTAGAREGGDMDRSPGTAPGEFPVPDRLLGREAEQGTLQAEFRRCRIGSGYPVIVHGDPGVGKTFLARHFQGWAEAQGARVLYTRFYEDHDASLSPYQIFLDLLSAAEESSFDSRNAANGEEQAPEISNPSSAFAQSIGQAFVRLSRQQPLVLIFDDLQWATPACRDAIGYLMRASDGESLMLLGLARSEDLSRADHPVARWLSRQAAQRRFTSLSLESFDRTRFGAVLRALVPGPAGTSDVPPADVRRLYDLSGGNPYFLIELLRLLVTRGTLAWEQHPVPGWRWRNPGEWTLPDTLVMAARSKLYGLPPELLDVLQGAAVLGDEFRLATLQSLLGLPTLKLEKGLDAAVNHGLLTHRGLLPGSDYGFRHSLVRQVILEDLAPFQRRRLHAAAAGALQPAGSDSAPALAAALSWHYEAAGQHEETVTWSLAAWREARSRAQWPEAMRLLERARGALDCTNEGGTAGRQRLETMLGQAEAAWQLGQLKRSRDCAEAALALARHAAEPVFEAGALLQQACTAVALGHYRAAERAAESAADCFIELQDTVGVSKARMQLAAARTAMGNYRSATEVMHQILKRSRDASTIDAANGQLGWALALQGRFSEAVPPLQSSVAGAERLGQARELAVRLRRLHWVHLSVGEYGEAYALARRAYALARRVDDAFDEAKAIMGMGQARLGQGLCGEAIAYLRRTLDKLQQVGDSHCEAESLWLLGRAHCESGRIEAARELLTRALVMVREIGDRDDEFRFLIDLGRVELAAQRPETALPLLTESAAIATELGSRDGLGLARAEHANALAALARPTEALDEARSAVALLDESGSAERWRGYWALARALRTAGGESAQDPASCISALRRVVDLLDRIRDQLPAQDVMRRREATLSRCEAAMELADLLRHMGQVEEAVCLEDSWDLPDSRTG